MAVVFLCISCSGKETGRAAVPDGNTGIYQVAANALRPVGKDTAGGTFDSTATNVFVFLSPECPLCVSYAPVMNAISDSIKSCRMRLVGVFPGTTYSEQEINAYRAEYAVTFGCLTDKSLAFTRKLGATVTPEVFVTDSAGTLLYHGRIDDWMYEVGKKRLQPTRFDLRIALAEICSGKKVSVSETTPLGCFIEHEKH